MRANTGILIIIGLLLLVGTVGAAMPDTVTITSDKAWVVANGVDQSIYYRGSNKYHPRLCGPIQGATVTFSINNTSGNIKFPRGLTDSLGRVSTNFKANTKSGATLIARISYLLR